MKRTQIYLTDAERTSLDRLAHGSDKSMSELIREAIDEYIAERESRDRLNVLDDLAGIWKDRRDLPDFSEMRTDWDRS